MLIPKQKKLILENYVINITTRKKTYSDSGIYLTNVKVAQ